MKIKAAYNGPSQSMKDKSRQQLDDSVKKSEITDLEKDDPTERMHAAI